MQGCNFCSPALTCGWCAVRRYGDCMLYGYPCSSSRMRSSHVGSDQVSTPRIQIVEPILLHQTHRPVIIIWKLAVHACQHHVMPAPASSKDGWGNASASVSAPAPAAVNIQTQQRANRQQSQRNAGAHSTRPPPLVPAPWPPRSSKRTCS